MFRKEFLEKALASKDQRQQLDHLLRVTAPHERLLLAGIGVLLLALAVWAFFGSITLGLRLEGVLIEPGDRYEVMAAEPGHLVEVLVVPGDRAEAGDAIARQTAPGLERETEALRERVELLETEIRQAGGGGGLRSVLDTALAVLLEIEARRSARELIVSQLAGEIMTLRSSPGDYLPAGAAVAQLRAGFRFRSCAGTGLSRREDPFCRGRTLPPGGMPTVTGGGAEPHGGQAAAICGEQT